MLALPARREGEGAREVTIHASRAGISLASAMAGWEVGIDFTGTWRHWTPPNPRHFAHFGPFYLTRP
jgi:hypothetical protein